MTTSKKFPELVLLSLLSLGACKSVEIGDGAAPKSKAAQPFSDSFERTDLGENWTRGVGEAGSGKWEIKEGELHGSGLKNDPLWLKKPLPQNARVTFDATALSPEGDLKVEIYGDGKNHASGYVVIMGGWNNSLDVIARLDEHGKDRLAKKSIRVKPNQTYSFEITREPTGALVWKVDGKLVAKYADKSPLKGSKHAYFAFSNWNAPVKFDNLKITAM